MAPVPAWTEREWRPLALELVERLAARRGASQDADPAADAEASAVALQELQEALLLRADRVVGKLYMGGFLESTRPQVLSQARALATKFRVHSLDERAERLERLAGECDFQVLKMLMELAVRPTAASDERIRVDAVEEGQSEYYMRLAELKAKEKEGEAKEQELRDQLIDEMVEISTNDDWYQEWDATSDEDEDMDSVASDEIGKPAPWPVESSFAQMRRPKRTSAAVEEDDVVEEDTTANDSVQSSRNRVQTSLTSSSLVELPDDELHDFLVSQNFQLVDTSSGHFDIQQDEGAFQQDTMSIELDSRELASSRFSMDRPWLLCSAVVADSSKRTRQTDASPVITLIHEETCINMVFRALQGVESDLFEIFPSSCKRQVFNRQLNTSEFRLTPLAQRVSVSHLSPGAFKSALQEFAATATDLELLRTYQEQLRLLSIDAFSIVTLDGLSSALSEVLRLIDATILAAEQECYHYNDDSSPDDSTVLPVSWFARNASRTQSTLLGIRRRLITTFRIVSWLSRALPPCLEAYQQNEHTDIQQPSKCSSWLLTSLYRQLDAELLEETQNSLLVNLNINDEDLVGEWKWSRCDVLQHLFVGALCPYIDLLTNLLFDQRGWSFSDISELPAELFFVNSSQPVSTIEDQSFRAGLSQLTSYDIDATMVPEFLVPYIEPMRMAISSRQLMNHFLSMDYSKRTDSHELNHPPRSLRDQITEGIFSTRSYSTEGALQTLPRVRKTQDQRNLSSLMKLDFEAVSAKQLLYESLGAPLEDRCQVLNGAIAVIFRERLQYLDYIQTLRLFVLMQQQDVFGIFCKRIVAQIVRDPVGWANSESINANFQNAIQQMSDEKMVSPAFRQIAERIHIRIDSKQLNSQLLSRRIDIGSIRCLYFTLSAPQPLRVLFSSSIMEKYSRISIFLLQVKAVESTIIQFKRGIRYRKSFSRFEDDLRAPLLQLADMLHYTKSLLAYLTDQIVSEEWATCCHVLRSSTDLAEMDATHEIYLDQLLNRFFLLDKHATVTQYILSTFNQIMRYVRLLDDCVAVSDRFLGVEGEHEGVIHSTEANPSNSWRSIFTLPGNIERRDDMGKCSGEFRRQSHFLVVMLTAMAKHSTSTQVAEILTRLNFNYFYHDQPQDRRGGYSTARPQPAPKSMLSRQRTWPLKA